MAFSRSYSDALKGSINARHKPVIMEIFESHKHFEWTTFRNIAIEILNHAQKLKLPLKIDNLTYGDGSCFMISILQQCRRPEIQMYCQENVINMSEKFDYMKFRSEVADFMINSTYSEILAYKRRYEETEMHVTKRSWIDYWNQMRKSHVWADGHFVQGTAFYLGIDIWIVATKSKEKLPYIKVFSNLENPNTPGIAPPIILGLKGDSHYQSLLPVDYKNLSAVTKQTYAEIVTKNLDFKGNVKFDDNQKKECNKEGKKEKEMEDDGKESESGGWVKVLTRNKKRIRTHTPKQNPVPLKHSNSSESNNSFKAPKKKQNSNLTPVKIKPIKTKVNKNPSTPIKNDSNESSKNTPLKPKTKKLKVNNNDKNSNKQEYGSSDSSFEEIFKASKIKIKEKKSSKETKDSKTKCPGCKNLFKEILKHFANKGKKCIEKCSGKEIAEFKKRSKERKKVAQKNRAKSYRSKARLTDFGKYQEQKREIKRKSRIKNLEKEKESNKLFHQKWRKLDTPNDRLKSFLKSTMHNAIFICVCCNLRHFKSNVVGFSSDLKENISLKNPNIIEDCIGRNKNLAKFQTVALHEKWKSKFQEKIDSNYSQYICNTCLNYIKKNKMPPMCWKNGLELFESVSDIKKQSLWLTELEGALIARKLIFMKIFLLPKSRWTAFKDKAINIPIPESAVLNTIKVLPRTPNNAGLVAVSLKRKKEFKNTHKAQLVDPKKIFAVLEKLKQNKNPYFKFYDDYSAFQKRCFETDPKGYEFTFGRPAVDDLEESFESHEVFYSNKKAFQSDEVLSDEISSADENSDTDFEDSIDKKNDPARKYNFDYDKSVCYTNKYPEISVAPGEGQKPEDLSKEKDWDIQAFPHLHNFDGSNGVHQERKVKLSNHQYFLNRICHKDTRFSQTPSYLYSAVAFIEKNQIQRNYHLAGTRGIKTESSAGISYQLKDGYRVLENVKGTPTYYKTGKQEMLSKLDNFGAFQFFFTLSCADTRWTSNFTPIFLEEDYDLRFSLEQDEDEIWKTKIDARLGTEKEWKDIEDFIREMDESKHEIIRGNVVHSTRYFQHRVKQFLSKIVLNKDNPMNVYLYSYKMEFQQRGAGNNFEYLIL